MENHNISTTQNAGAILAELEGLYRNLILQYRVAYSSVYDCGNALVADHRAMVLGEIDQTLAEPLTVSPTSGAALPVARYLEATLKTGRLGVHPAFVDALMMVSGRLNWEYGYAEMPDNLRDLFAYAEIAGQTGSVRVGRLALGLVLFGPGCVYPPHGHPGIAESYIVISGAVSQNDFGIFGPGSVIFNPPGREHMITVDQMAPALLAYAWTADEAILATNEMKLSA
ncbi:MAG: dimethylsulfonioproprionate lyase family protein [Pseudomonadota bacterium]